MFQYGISIRIINPENIGVDTRIVILFQLQRGPGHQYSFLDLRLATARNVQVQKQKAIFNNHACPQSYNTFLYNVSKIIWFSVYNV